MLKRVLMRLLPKKLRTVVSNPQRAASRRVEDEIVRQVRRRIR